MGHGSKRTTLVFSLIPSKFVSICFTTGLKSTRTNPKKLVSSSLQSGNVFRGKILHLCPKCSGELPLNCREQANTRSGHTGSADEVTVQSQTYYKQATNKVPKYHFVSSISIRLTVFTYRHTDNLPDQYLAAYRRPTPVPLGEFLVGQLFTVTDERLTHM